ncbi:MAG TPA: hypothetical protein VGN06_04945 [Gaiellaceae bacterium]|jgi:hypothetical protein
MTRGVLLVLAVLALAGCSGASTRPPVAKPPHLPRALAHAWVTESNAIAQALAARDGCTARDHANALRSDVDQAAGEIPARLRATLQPIVDALPGRITCNPAPPPPKHGKEPKPPKHDHGHGHGNGDNGQ